jgi:hypothetical protein
LKEQERLDNEVDEESEYDDEEEFKVEKEEPKEFMPLFDDLKKKIDIENELNEGLEHVEEEIKGETKDDDIAFNST